MPSATAVIPSNTSTVPITVTPTATSGGRGSGGDPVAEEPTAPTDITPVITETPLEPPTQLEETIDMGVQTIDPVSLPVGEDTLLTP